jgi:hypothetical protein
VTDDVDPENPRPAGHYGRFRDAPWYYVSDDLAETVLLGPATDAEPGDDWILSFTGEGATDEDRERVCVRLTPRALQRLYVETKDLHPDARQAGHTAECTLCGERVVLENAWPDGEGLPTHPDCWSEAYQTPAWRE